MTFSNKLSVQSTEFQTWSLSRHFTTTTLSVSLITELHLVTLMNNRNLLSLVKKTDKTTVNEWWNTFSCNPLLDRIVKPCPSLKLWWVINQFLCLSRHKDNVNDIHVLFFPLFATLSKKSKITTNILYFCNLLVQLQPLQSNHLAISWSWPLSYSTSLGGQCDYLLFISYCSFLFCATRHVFGMDQWGFWMATSHHLYGTISSGKSTVP